VRGKDGTKELTKNSANCLGRPEAVMNLYIWEWWQQRTVDRETQQGFDRLGETLSVLSYPSPHALYTLTTPTQKIWQQSRGPMSE
jgi:hypothetical protein